MLKRSAKDVAKALRSTALALVGIAGLSVDYCTPAQAQQPFKIGVIEDLTGPYSGIAGPGTVAAIKMAVAEFGGKVLGRDIEVLVATDQNKPDIGSGIARRWFEQEGVMMIAGLQSSNTALAVQNIAREFNRINIVTSAATAELTGRGCSPTGFHWHIDTNASANSLVDALVKEGGNRWYFITVDYNYGHVLQADATTVIQQAGGRVLGSSKHPLGALDYSSVILSAQSSGANVIGIANAGADLDNVIKAANEFRLLQGGKQRLAAFFLQTVNIQSVGQDLAKGLYTPTAFFPNLNEETKAWSIRFSKEVGHDRPPTANQAAGYAGVLHYLKSVSAAGTDDAKVVAAKMRELPVNDMMTKDAIVRKDGRLVRDVYVVQVKEKAAAKDKFDLFDLVATVPSNRAFRSLAEAGCPYAQ